MVGCNKFEPGNFNASGIDRFPLILWELFCQNPSEPIEKCNISCIVTVQSSRRLSYPGWRSRHETKTCGIDSEVSMQVVLILTVRESREKTLWSWKDVKVQLQPLSRPGPSWESMYTRVTADLCQSYIKGRTTNSRYAAMWSLVILSSGGIGRRGSLRTCSQLSALSRETRGIKPVRGGVPSKPRGVCGREAQ